MGSGKRRDRRPAGGPSSWRAVALPAEHGSWGLVLEPLLLGLLVAPTPAGWALALTAFAAFLLRQPMRTLLTAARRGRATGRTALARRVALGYGAVAGLGALVTWWLLVRPGGPGLRPLWPLLLALPAATAFLWFEGRAQPRHPLAEAAGAALYAPLPAVLALLAGFDSGTALSLAAIILARAWPAIAYVRARIRLEKGKTSPAALRRDQLLVGLAGALALLLVAWLVQRGWLAWPALLPFLILLARALEGLRADRYRLSIRALGFGEMGLGFLTVFLVAIGLIARG